MTRHLIALSTLLFACNNAPAPPTKDTAATAAAAAKPELMEECPGEDKSSCGDQSPEPASADQKHFGGAFAVDKREELSAALKRLGDNSKGETVQVSGTVDAVCKKKGCWMVLKDGDITARVFTHAGDFYLPLDTNKGRKCIVEGALEPKTVSEKFAKHLAEDQGKDPSKVAGEQREWVLQATSIELL
jgi:hypothetical protein